MSDRSYDFPRGPLSDEFYDDEPDEFYDDEGGCTKHDPSPDEFYGNEEGHTKRDIPKDSHCVLFDPKAQGKKDSGTVIDKIGKFGSGDMVNIFLGKASIGNIRKEGSGSITNIILSGEHTINNISKSYDSTGTIEDISIDTATPEQLRVVVKELSGVLQALATGERVEIPTILWEDSGEPDPDDSGACNDSAGISLDKDEL